MSRSVWLAIALFAALALAPRVISRGAWIAVALVIALVSIPLIWQSMKARKSEMGLSRGAVAGAMCAVAILLGPTFDYSIRRPSDGGWFSVPWFVYLGGLWFVGITAGAVLGTLFAALQRPRGKRPS